MGRGRGRDEAIGWTGTELCMAMAIGYLEPSSGMAATLETTHLTSAYHHIRPFQQQPGVRWWADNPEPCSRQRLYLGDGV